MLLQQQLEKIMRKKKFSKLVSSCQYYCLLGTVHTTSSAGGFDFCVCCSAVVGVVRALLRNVPLFFVQKRKNMNNVKIAIPKDKSEYDRNDHC